MQTSELRKQLGCTDGQLTAILHQWNKQSSVRVDPLNDEVPDNIAQQLIQIHQENCRSKRLKAGKKAVAKPSSNQASNIEIESVDWTEALDELGMDESKAIALIEEVGLDRNNLTRSDVIALKDLAPIPAAAADIANHIKSSESIQQGFVDQYIEQRREQAEILADTGNIVFAKALLAGQITGLEQVSDLNSAILADYMATLNQKLDEITQQGKEQPGEIVQKLGTRATVQAQATKTTVNHRQTRMNLSALRNK